VTEPTQSQVSWVVGPPFSQLHKKCVDWSLVMEEPITKPLSGSGCLIRLYWIFGGNLILFFLAIFIGDKHFPFPSLFDLAYWIIAATLVAVRYIDIRYMQGETAEGKPASMKDFRSYAIILIIVSFLMWALTFLRR
jgi:hypothetical protein